MKTFFCAIALVLGLAACEQRKKTYEVVDNSGSASTYPSNETPVETAKVEAEVVKKPLGLSEVGLGWTADKVLAILQQREGYLDSTTHGKIDRRLKQYNLSQVDWWGVTGKVTVEFADNDEEISLRHLEGSVRPNESRIVQWTSEGLTTADLKIIANKISQQLQVQPSREFMTMYEWETKSREYSLSLIAGTTIFMYVPKRISESVNYED